MAVATELGSGGFGFDHRLPGPLIFSSTPPAIGRRHPPTLPRAAGHHVTGLIYDVAVKNAVLKRQVEEDDPSLTTPGARDWKMSVLMALGCAWEEFYSQFMGDLFVYHPEQLSRDGVSGNPDGYFLDTQGEIESVWECKLTYKSAARPLHDFWLYLAQGKSYCYMCGCNQFRLDVLFVKGDYTDRQDNCPVVLKRWLIKFTDNELIANWKMLMKEKR